MTHATPCPTCGCEPTAEHNGAGWTVACSGCADYCDIEGPTEPVASGRTFRDAVEDWNDLIAQREDT